MLHARKALMQDMLYFDLITTSDIVLPDCSPYYVLCVWHFASYVNFVVKFVYFVKLCDSESVFLCVVINCLLTCCFVTCFCGISDVLYSVRPVCCLVPTNK